MARPKKKGVYLYLNGRLGEKQLRLGDCMKITYTVSQEYMDSVLADGFLKPQEQYVLSFLKDELTHDFVESPSKYTQDWTSYNRAQTSEKIIFMEILSELCQYVDDEDYKGNGRPKLDTQEMLYSMCLHTYVGKSTRRTISELKIANDRNHISFVPHFNSISNYYNNPFFKDQLAKLITMSSLPLKQVEKSFTVDSSGFSTSCFARWFDHKWGKEEPEEMKQRIWRKAHVMSGTATNIITSLEVTRGTVSDTTMMPPLVKSTAKNFNMKEVSADAAYSSMANHNLIDRHGAVPFIMFKKNAKANQKGRKGRIWKYMHYFFTEYQEHFLKHYHKRSNAETVFSMLKRKFNMNLRSKTEIGQDNEILCKALCHNICVLIQEMFELGISADFLEQVRDFCAKGNPAQEARA